MIKTKAQFNRTKEYAEAFKLKMEALYAERENMDSLDFEFSYNAAKYQYDQLKAEMDEYACLTNGTSKALTNKSLDQLDEVLVQARLARGWTQGELANELGMAQQQIQRYEKENYEKASLVTVLDVVDALELKIELKDIALPESHYELPENLTEKRVDSIQKKLREQGSLFLIG